MIVTKLGTRDLCASVQKSVEQIFEILVLKFLAIFFQFYIGTTAAELSRPTDISSMETDNLTLIAAIAIQYLLVSHSVWFVSHIVNCYNYLTQLIWRARCFRWHLFLSLLARLQELIAAVITMKFQSS